MGLGQQQAGYLARSQVLALKLLTNHKLASQLEDFLVNNKIRLNLGNPLSDSSQLRRNLDSNNHLVVVFAMLLAVLIQVLTIKVALTASLAASHRDF